MRFFKVQVLVVLLNAWCASGVSWAQSSMGETGGAAPSMAVESPGTTKITVDNMTAPANAGSQNAESGPGSAAQTGPDKFDKAGDKKTTDNAALRNPQVSQSSFQKFVQESTGQQLPRFGDDALNSSAFAALTNLPVPSDYMIGPGDEVLLRVWGGIDVNYSAVVDRDGQLSVPKVGTFRVAGVRSSDLNSFLTSQIGRYYQNFNLSATLGKLQGIQVYVVGQASQAGIYNVSSLSTLVSAVFSIAKPGPNGSYRNIVLKRSGREVARFDLYKFLQNGDLSADAKLSAGDVLVVEKVGPSVAILGAVEKPAVYEMLPGESLQAMLTLAGTQGPLTGKRELLVETFDFSSPSRPRQVQRLPYEEVAKVREVKDGDVVTVFGISSQFQNAVTLRGQVAAPLRYPFKEGMRVSDLIPDEAALLSPDYYQRTNRLVQFTSSPRAKGVDELTASFKSRVDQVNWDYAVVERLNQTDIQTRLIPFNLRKALAKDPTNDLELKQGDVVTIFGVKDAEIPMAKREKLIKVSGEVNAAGYYQIAAGETIRDVLVKAGGITPNAYLFGTRLTRASTQKQQEEALQKALAEAERLVRASAVNNSASAVNDRDIKTAESNAAKQQEYLARLRSIKPDGRLVLNVPADSKTIAELPPISLENQDEVYIPSVPGAISIFGSVYSQGSFVYERGQTVMDYLDMAGGAAKNSDKGSIFVIRANGTVNSAQQGWVPFVSGLYASKALPGDAIYVPEDLDRISFTKTLLDISQIFYQVGLGAAAVRAIQK